MNTLRHGRAKKPCTDCGCDGGRGGGERGCDIWRNGRAGTRTGVDGWVLPRARAGAGAAQGRGGLQETRQRRRPLGGDPCLAAGELPEPFAPLALTLKRADGAACGLSSAACRSSVPLSISRRHRRFADDGMRVAEPASPAHILAGELQCGRCQYPNATAHDALPSRASDALALRTG